MPSQPFVLVLLQFQRSWWQSHRSSSRRKGSSCLENIILNKRHPTFDMCTWLVLKMSKIYFLSPKTSVAPLSSPPSDNGLHYVCAEHACLDLPWVGLTDWSEEVFHSNSVFLGTDKLTSGYFSVCFLSLSSFRNKPDSPSLSVYTAAALVTQYPLNTPQSPGLSKAGSSFHWNNSHFWCISLAVNYGHLFIACALPNESFSALHSYLLHPWRLASSLTLNPFMTSCFCHWKRSMSQCCSEQRL